MKLLYRLEYFQKQLATLKVLVFFMFLMGIAWTCFDIYELNFQWYILTWSCLMMLNVVFICSLNLEQDINVSFRQLLKMFDHNKKFMYLTILCGLLTLSINIDLQISDQETDLDISVLYITVFLLAYQVIYICYVNKVMHQAKTLRLLLEKQTKKANKKQKQNLRSKNVNTTPEQIQYIPPVLPQIQYINNRQKRSLPDSFLNIQEKNINNSEGRIQHVINYGNAVGQSIKIPPISFNPYPAQIKQPLIKERAENIEQVGNLRDSTSDYGL